MNALLNVMGLRRNAKENVLAKVSVGVNSDMPMHVWVIFVRVTLIRVFLSWYPMN